MFESVIWVLHVLAAVCMIGLVLMQHGKGADVGAAFGSGSAGSLFGSTGAANFLSRTTAVLAAVFFATSLGLTYFSTHTPRHSSIMDTHKTDLKVAPAAKAVEKKEIPPAPQSSLAPDSKAKDIPK